VRDTYRPCPFSVTIMCKIATAFATVTIDPTLAYRAGCKALWNRAVRTACVRATSLLKASWSLLIVVSISVVGSENGETKNAKGG